MSNYNSLLNSSNISLDNALDTSANNILCGTSAGVYNISNSSVLTFPTNNIQYPSTSQPYNYGIPTPSVGVYGGYNYQTYPTNILSKYIFNFKDDIYNKILLEKVCYISDNSIILNIEHTVNMRIEPLDTINLLMKIPTTLIIQKTKDSKVLCNIKLKNFKFTKIINLLTFTDTLNVEYTYDTVCYDNPNIPLQEKRNIKINNILK